MKKYYQMYALKDSEDEAEILIYEQIGESFFSDGIGAKQFAKDLKALGGVSTINVRINSLGGSVFEGITIYNLLKAHKAKIIVHIDGIAASIASVIAMAGDEINMPANAMLFLHMASAFSMSMLNAKQLRKMASDIEKIDKSMIAAYLSSATIDESDLIELLNDETYLTAQEVKDWGFNVTVTEEVKAVAACIKSVDLNFLNIKAASVPAKIEKGEDMKKEEITKEFLEKELPELVTAFKVQGAESERERIKGVQAQLIPGHEEIIATLMFDGSASAGDAAIAIVKAEKLANKTALDAIEAGAPDPAKPVVIPPKEPGKIVSFEDKIKVEWDKSAELQKEFLSFEQYSACMVAEQREAAR